MVERLMTGGRPALGRAATPASSPSPVARRQLQRSPASPARRRRLAAAEPTSTTPATASPTPTSTAFDAQLGQVAKLYDPTGCPDPHAHPAGLHGRLQRGLPQDGNCGAGQPVQVDHRQARQADVLRRLGPQGLGHPGPGHRPAMLGNSAPNTLPMYDDGTNGDEVAGDGIYTIVFDVPRDPAGQEAPHRLQVHVGLPGRSSGPAPRSGRATRASSRWSTTIERRRLRLPPRRLRRRGHQQGQRQPQPQRAPARSPGTTDLRGCGIPEAREQKFDVTPQHVPLRHRRGYTPPKPRPHQRRLHQ